MTAFDMKDENLLYIYFNFIFFFKLKLDLFIQNKFKKIHNIVNTDKYLHFLLFLALDIIHI